MVDIKLGEWFFLDIGSNFNKLYICTDVGSRVIVGIENKEDWLAGPPYALTEKVFDEDDQKILVVIPKPTNDVEIESTTDRSERG